jgi:GntR family transcriptional regulator
LDGTAANAGGAGPGGGKTRRVYLALRERIAGGRLAPGSVLPGEHRLAAELGVSRVTVRSALEALAAEGLVERRVGAGAVVREPEAAAGGRVAADMAALIPRIEEIGRTSVRLLAFGYGPAPAAAARALGLAEGAEVQSATRVRSLGGRAFSHLVTHVPAEIAAGYSEADLATTPLFQLLERSGVRLAEADQRVTATLAGPETAEALGVPTGAPLLSLTRTVRDAEGRGVEHLSALYRPDVFALEMRYARVGDGKARHWEPVIGAEGDEA